MKELEGFAGKRMPYREDGDYVSGLVSRCADVAVSQATKPKRRFGTAISTKVFARALAVAAVLVVGVLLFGKFTGDSAYEILQKSQPLADVLESMSEEELMCVNYYTVEDIPEYE